MKQTQPDYIILASQRSDLQWAWTILEVVHIVQSIAGTDVRSEESNTNIIRDDFRRTIMVEVLIDSEDGTIRGAIIYPQEVIVLKEQRPIMPTNMELIRFHGSYAT